MTNTYTQDEAVRDILRITLDSSIRPLSQTHGDQVREILDQLIATTWRETVEEIRKIFIDKNNEIVGDNPFMESKYIFSEIMNTLDQLPDKQEV